MPVCVTLLFILVVEHASPGLELSCYVSLDRSTPGEPAYSVHLAQPLGERGGEIRFRTFPDLREVSYPKADVRRLSLPHGGMAIHAWLRSLGYWHQEGFVFLGARQSGGVTVLERNGSWREISEADPASWEGLSKEALSGVIRVCARCGGIGKIPVLETCTACAGKGRTTCDRCKGTGRFEQLDTEPIIIEDPCRTCNGKGYVEKHCTACSGWGMRLDTVAWEDCPEDAHFWVDVDVVFADLTEKNAQPFTAKLKELSEEYRKLRRARQRLRVEPYRLKRLIELTTDRPSSDTYPWLGMLGKTAYDDFFDWLEGQPEGLQELESLREQKKELELTDLNEAIAGLTAKLEEGRSIETDCVYRPTNRPEQLADFTAVLADMRKLLENVETIVSGIEHRISAMHRVWVPHVLDWRLDVACRRLEKVVTRSLGRAREDDLRRIASTEDTIAVVVGPSVRDRARAENERVVNEISYAVWKAILSEQKRYPVLLEARSVAIQLPKEQGADTETVRVVSREEGENPRPPITEGWWKRNRTNLLAGGALIAVLIVILAMRRFM